jgi:hypothetical protein
LDESSREITSPASFVLSCIRDFLRSINETPPGIVGVNFSGLGETTGFPGFEETAACSRGGEGIDSSDFGGGNDMVFLGAGGENIGFLSGSDAARTNVSFGSSGAVATEVGAFLLGPRARFFVMWVS